MKALEPIGTYISGDQNVKMATIENFDKECKREKMTTPSILEKWGFQKLLSQSMSLGNAIEQNKLAFCWKGCAQLATAKT